MPEQVLLGDGERVAAASQRAARVSRELAQAGEELARVRAGAAQAAAPALAALSAQAAAGEAAAAGARAALACELRAVEDDRHALAREVAELRNRAAGGAEEPLVPRWARAPLAAAVAVIFVALLAARRRQPT
jgi:hypothetical protein